MGWGGGGKGGAKGWGSGGNQKSGNDWGRMRRQQEQAACKDAKNERESNYFWEKQAHLGKTPPHQKSGWKLQEEEKELFGNMTDNVGIDFDRYDDISVEVSGQGADQIKAVNSFAELWDYFQIPDFLWDNVERCKYVKPTPIQKYAIPVALNGRDAMCCAQTGSGKTAAFLFPILCAIDEQEATGTVGIQVGKPASPKAIIMAPTRELCSQIHLESRKLGFKSKIRTSEVYGGVEAKPQLWDLALGSDVVTATPGRLTDFINRGVISMSAVRFLCLDEADRMLDMGFEPQIREVVQKRDMPRPEDGRMTLMFSATFPREMQKLAQEFMRTYIWVGVGRVGGAVDSVEQNFMLVNNNRKQSTIIDVLRKHPNESTLIFVAMKRTAASLEQLLCQNGFGAVAIHGDMEQPAREDSLSRFRNGKAKCLVATDVAARGLDIPVVAHVVNFDLPENIEDYVHRIGRTGRIGNRGRATSFYANEGNWANTKILGKLMGLLSDAGQPIPDCLQKEAQRNGVRSGQGGGGGGKRYGGNDVRGGKVWTTTVKRGGGGKGSKGGKGATGGKGAVKPAGCGGLIRPMTGSSSVGGSSLIKPLSSKPSSKAPAVATSMGKSGKGGQIGPAAGEKRPIGQSFPGKGGAGNAKRFKGGK